MAYLLSFLEGIATFISPCILPMIPIYFVYFAGGMDNEEASNGKTLVNASCFVLGFTVVFVALGAFAGSIGSFLTTYQTAVNIVCGALIILFGLKFMGVLKLGFLDKVIKPQSSLVPSGVFSSFLFGIVFAIGWSPCVGAFLGAALLMAAQQGSMLQGIVMLVCYSVGLGIPFILSAVLIKQVEGAFSAIKRNYQKVNFACGALLVVVGVLMATGYLGQLLSLLSF